MRMNLLQITQDALNDSDADEVNSIDDTVESSQVAQIVRSTYFAMMSNRNWPHLRKRINLWTPGINSQPTHLSVPDDVKEMIMVTYDCRKKANDDPDYRELKYLEPDAFLRKQNRLKLSAKNVQSVVDQTGVEFLIVNDKAPEYYTSFNDKVIVCDSWDEALEDTLQNSKTQALAYVMPEWEHRDDFVPFLPDEAFASLIEQVKTRVASKLRQTVDRESKEEANRQRRWLARKDWSVAGGLQYPSYGRRR